MNKRNLDDLSSYSMLDLFRVETESQTSILTAGLLELERGDPAPQQLEILMRAAHSLKGAARIVNLAIAVKIAHAMEDFFVSAQKGRLQVTKPDVDQLLKGVDLLLQSSKQTEPETWLPGKLRTARRFISSSTRCQGPRLCRAQHQLRPYQIHLNRPKKSLQPGRPNRRRSPALPSLNR